MNKTKYQEQETLDFLVKLHPQACSNFNKLYKKYFNNEHIPEMKNHIERLVNIVKDTILNPSLSTKDTALLNEVKELKQLIKKVFKYNNEDIKISMQDGVITNNGILHIYWNYNKSKLLISRRDPYSIIFFTDKRGREFVIDFENDKLWTKEHLYNLKNNIIIAKEPNYFGIIPFIQYRPHRIEIGGTYNTKEHLAVFGNGAEELKNIQDRLDTIGIIRLETLEKIQDPPIAYSGNITREQILEATTAGTRIKMSAEDKIDPININHTLSLQTLDMSEQKNKQHLQESTGQTPMTMGTNLSASTSGEAIKQHKASMMIHLKAYEEQYIKIFEELVKIVFVFYFYQYKKFQHINIDEIEIKNWSQEIDPTQYMTLLQNISVIVGQAQDELSLEMTYLVIKPQIIKLASQMDDPEEFIEKFELTLEKRKELLKQIQGANQNAVQNPKQETTQNN